MKYFSLAVLYIYSSSLFGQPEIKAEYDLFSFRENDCLIINLRFYNNSDSAFLLYLQNWRLATSADGKIKGAPFSVSLMNKFYLIEKGIAFHDAFTNEDEHYGDLYAGCFKKLGKKESFDLKIIILDKVFISNMLSGKFNLYYKYSFAEAHSIEHISEKTNNADVYFSDKHEKIVVFNKSDYGNEMKLYDFRLYRHFLSDIDYDSLSKLIIDGFFIPKIFEFNVLPFKN